MSAASPALQVGQDGNYIYFRLQLRSQTLSAQPNGAYMIYVDRVGWNNAGSLPDFAFAWDSKSNDTSKHGLEMSRFNSAPSGTWNDLTMADVDANPASKLSADINGNGRTGDGFVRVITGADGVGGAGQNSYVEIAVAVNYLENDSTTGLARGQTWRIAAGTIQNATDHGTLPPNGDILGAAYSDSILNYGWSQDLAISAVPEIPASPWLVLGFLGLAGCLRRFRAPAAGRAFRCKTAGTC